MRNIDPDTREILALAGRLGARTRDLHSTPEQRAANTAAARAAKAANYLERLKAEVDPDGHLDPVERERQAHILLEARAAKRQLERLRSERKQRLIDGRVELVDAHAS